MFSPLLRLFTPFPQLFLPFSSFLFSPFSSPFSSSLSLPFICLFTFFSPFLPFLLFPVFLFSFSFYLLLFTFYLFHLLFHQYKMTNSPLSFSFFFHVSVVRADAKTRNNRRSRTVPVVKMCRFPCMKIRFLGLGGQAVRKGRIEGDFSFAFFISFVTFSIFVSSWKYVPFFSCLTFRPWHQSIDVSSVVGAPWRCGALTTWGWTAGIGLGHPLGREHDSTPKSGGGGSSPVQIVLLLWLLFGLLMLLLFFCFLLSRFMVHGSWFMVLVLVLS